MVFRIGKNYSRTCPPCPRDPQYCANYLEVTTEFTTSDKIWAIYETNCVGVTPNVPMNWYKKNVSGGWDPWWTYNPGQSYPTALEVYLNPPGNGCYKVEYDIYSKNFTVGTGCPSFVVTGVTAELSTNPSFPGNEGWVRLSITYTGILGTWNITDGVTTILTNGNITPIMIKLAPGTHAICVTAN